MRRLGRCRECRRYIARDVAHCPFCRNDAAAFALGQRGRAVARTLWGVVALTALGGCGPMPVPGQPTALDSDEDGLADAVDRCPEAPEDVDGFEDSDGCPDFDNDGDGNPDTKDRCPGVAEDPNGVEDDDGCPDADADGDGILDLDDRCAADAEDRDGFEDDDGCPEFDNDGDGISDVEDECPNEAETVDGVTDLDGCPEEPRRLAIYGQPRIEIREMVNFEKRSEAIPSETEAVLDELAQVIRDNPQIGVIEVEGHTDAREKRTAAKRDALSLKRAEAVRDALVERGVEPVRLEVVGYGDAKPIDTDETADGRARNRRVAFRILEQP